MKTTEGITVQQANELVSGFSAARGQEAIIDPIACSFALVAIDLLLVGIFSIIRTGFTTTGGFSSDEKGLIFMLAPFIFVLSLWQRGAYTVSQAPPSIFRVVIGYLNGCGLLALGALSIAVLGPPIRSTVDFTALMNFFVTAAVLVLARNALWLIIWPHLRPRLAKTPVAVVGSGQELYAFVKSLMQDSTQQVVGIADLDDPIDQIVALVRGHMVRTVFIVPSTNDPGIGDRLLVKLLAFPVKLRIVLDIDGFGGQPRVISMAAGRPVLHIADPPFSRTAAVVKRAEDIVISLLLLLATAPIMLAAAIAIKLESRGPVLFRQPRQGLGNIEIEVFKFRTMYAHFEDRLALSQTMRRDPRVTHIGAFLRRHSLDELPQLLNVLVGTMSLVGPRPHALGTTAGGQSLDSAAGNYMARHRVKPGITGWAQVSGCRGNLDTVEKIVRRVQYDLEYIDNWSVLFDLWILVRTIRLVLYDHHAF